MFMLIFYPAAEHTAGFMPKPNSEKRKDATSTDAKGLIYSRISSDT